ncbi:MAG: SMC family ATPase [Chloroflexia bacterium]|nr:SMC family ATPase [Chloroflexia bacterium]
MILTRIQIENYKQYQGNHDIDVPAQATIGVIGENGSGKTTLFEAIEWCLYSPRAISPSDVRPRGYTGHTTVTVHLESVDGSQQFIVERVLKRAPSATIYRVHASGDMEKVVDGTRQVSDYVATKLIGLSHTAFTATFFTRQKELHLFGDQTPGKRREEVGRLLGLETIRTAQKSIIADRSKAVAEARAMLAQYEREAQGRNFDAELGTARAAIAERTAQLASDAAAVTMSQDACTHAETTVGMSQDRRDRDGAFGQDMRHRDQERQGFDQRLRRITSELGLLDQRASERASLAPVAETLEALRREIVLLEQERIRFEQGKELDRTLRECGERQREVNGAVRDVISQVIVSNAFTGWLWSTDDTLNPVAGVRRLLSIVESVDLPEAESNERRLQAARKAAADHINALATLDRYKQARADLVKDEQQVIVEGEPRDRIPTIDRERERLLHDRTVLHAKRTSLEADRDKSRLILKNLEEQHFGDDCPTCGRPFSEGDAEIVAAAVHQRIDGIAVEIKDIARDATAVNSAIDELDQRRKTVFTEIDALESLRKRIQKSVSFLEAQQETTDVATRVLEQALAESGFSSPPTNDHIASAERATRQLRALVSTRSSLRASMTTLEQLESRHRSATQQRHELGTVSFDPVAFQKLQATCQAADRAHSAIGQIDKDLARRPELESELVIATGRISELEKAIRLLSEQRTVLGFQPSELAHAQQELQAARARERDAVARFHRTTTSLRETELQRDSIVKELERLDRLAKVADAKRSEADHLEFMAKEFTEFERFAASRKRPILAEYTSHLVQGITGGKYDRVDFDQDFGIIVYDGDDMESSYAVDTFSGGERDAITLAARIALSQMIGRQAANPPGFLVLDEVFGSLDTDRRAHLLNMLGSISGTFDELRQVFIISHVDDVRTSPVLDELWRIEETTDGSSAVTCLGPGAEIDTL